MSVESIKGQAIEKLLNRSGNGRSQLESFGFFLDKYVIQGADITLDARNPRKFTLSEAIISIDDGLYRVSSETMTVRGVGATFFVDMTVKNGFIVNSQHPSGSYIPLWQINMDGTGNIISTVDMRGTMGYLRFRSEIQGIITNQLVVDEAHILDQSVGTTKIKDGAVTLAKIAPNAVDASKIVDKAIAARHVGFNAVDVPYAGLVPQTNVSNAIDVIKSTIDKLVVSGDSSPEAAAARVDSVTGVSYPTLQDRLNAMTANDVKKVNNVGEATLMAPGLYNVSFPNEPQDAIVYSGMPATVTFKNTNTIDNPVLRINAGQSGMMLLDKTGRGFAKGTLPANVPLEFIYDGKNGFVLLPTSAELAAQKADYASKIDQGVKTTDSPTFTKLTLTDDISIPDLSRAWVWAASGLNVPAGAWVPVSNIRNGGSSNNDPKSEYDPQTARFVSKQAGYYVVYAQVQIEWALSNTSQFMMRLNTYNGIYDIVNQSGTNRAWEIFSGAAMLYLPTLGHVGLEVYCDAAITIPANANTRLMIHKYA